MDYLDPNQQIGACYDNPLGASRFVSLDLVYKIEPVGNDFYLELNPLSLIRPLTVDNSITDFEHESKSITFNELPKFNQTFEKERVYLQGYTMRFTPSYSNRSDHYGSYGVVITNKDFQLKDYDAFYESSITQHSKLIDVQSNQSLDAIIPVTPQEVYSNEDFINPQKKRLLFQKSFVKNITIEDAQFNFQDHMHDDFIKLLNQNTLLYTVEFNAPVQDSFWDLFKSRSCIISGNGPIYQIYMDQSNNVSIDFNIIRRILYQPITQGVGSGLVKTVDIKIYSVKEHNTPRLILLGKTDGVQYTVDIKANYLVTSSSAYDFLGSPSIYPTQQDYIIRNSQIQFLYETGYPYVFIREDRIIQNFLKLYESITIEDVRGLTGDEGILKAGLFSNLGRWLKKNQKNLASIFLSLIKEDPVELAMSLNDVVQSTMNKKKTREIENVLRAGCSGFTYDQDLYPPTETQIYPIPPIGVVMDQIKRSKLKNKILKKRIKQQEVVQKEFFKKNGFNLITSNSCIDSSDESIENIDLQKTDSDEKFKTGCVIGQQSNDQQEEPFIQYQSPDIPMVHLDVSQSQLKYIQNRSPKYIMLDEPNKVGLDGLQLFGTDYTGQTLHWTKTKMFRRNFKKMMKNGFVTIPVIDMFKNQVNFQKIPHTKLDLLLDSLPAFKTLMSSFGFGESRPQLTVSRDKKGELWIVDLIRMYRTKNLILNSKIHHGLVFHIPNILAQNDHFNKYRKLKGGMYVRKDDSSQSKKYRVKQKEQQRNVLQDLHNDKPQTIQEESIKGQGSNVLELMQNQVINQGKGQGLITGSGLLDDNSSVEDNKSVLQNIRQLVRQNHTQAKKKTQTPKNNAFQNFLVYQNVKGIKLEFDDNPKAFNAASFRREGLYIVPLIQESKQKAIPSYFLWREGDRINENPSLLQTKTYYGTKENIIQDQGISLFLPSILKVSNKAKRVILDSILINRGTPGDTYGEEKLADIQITLDIIIDQNVEVKEISDDSWHASLIAFMNNIPNGTFVTGGLAQQIIQVDKREISTLAPQRMEIQYLRMKLNLFQEIKNLNPNKCAFFMVSNYLFITKFFQKEGQLAKFAVDQFISRLAPYQVLIFSNWNCIHDQLGSLMMSNNKYSSQLAQYVQDYMGLEGFYPLLKNVTSLLNDKVTITSTKLSTLLQQYPLDFGLSKEMNFQLGWNSELTGTFHGSKILRTPPTLNEPQQYLEISDFIKQTCIVDTNEFMLNNKNEVNKFISDYKKSTDLATDSNAKFANTYFLPQFTKANLLTNFVFFSKNKPEAFFNEDQNPKMQWGKLHGYNNYRTIAEAIYSKIVATQYSMYNQGSLSQLFIVTKWLIQRLEQAWKLQGKGPSLKKNSKDLMNRDQKKVVFVEPDKTETQKIQQDQEMEDYEESNDDYYEEQYEEQEIRDKDQRQNQIVISQVRNQDEQEIEFY